jgi:hypothetical protein
MMLKTFWIAAACGGALAASTASSAAQCLGGSFNIKEQQRIRVERRVTPGSYCSHSFSMRGLAVSSISPVRRPTQGRIEPAPSGRGSYRYQSNAGASGADSYVIRAEFDRMDIRSGQATGKTWAEVEFVVTFTR